jgi:trigger factor
MSSVKIENISKTRKRLVIPVSGEEVKQAEADVIASITREANLPGFRQGHAPEAMLRSKYARLIEEELRDKVIRDGYQKALKEADLELCAIVDVENDKIVVGRNTTVKVTADVYPEFKTPNYKGIEVKLPKINIEESEVEKTVEFIRGQRAEFTPAEREVRKGDYVRISYHGTLNGKAVSEIVPDQPIYGTQKNTWEEAGDHENGIKAIAEGLVGMKKGDKKTVQMEFDKKFAAAALSGKKVSYDIEVLELREKKLPELNEAFFKALGVKDLEELKKNIRASLENRAKEDQEDDKNHQISDALIDSADFPLPEALLKAESQQVLDEIIADNQQRGVSEELIKKNEKQMVETAKEAAQKRVKMRLVLRQIANDEKVQVTQEDLQRAVVNEAMRRQEAPEKFVKELSADRERLNNFTHALRLGKAMKLVVDAAKITEGVHEHKKKK